MFKSVIFYTSKLKSLKRFYGGVLGFIITESNDEQFTMKVGSSLITFKLSEQDAFYHFAINIPGNQFSMLKYWMKNRLDLNRDESRDEVYFPSFDADSMYFEDPAGNVVELIGRRKMDLFGDLTNDSFLNISEVGIATPFIADVGDQLQDFGIPLQYGTEVNQESVNFLGKDESFIVLVPPARRWYFSERLSETYPLEITLDDDRVITMDEDGKVILD